MTIQDWHDSYFRKVMQFPIVVEQFLTWLAPKDIMKNVDLKTVKMLNTTYIDKNLNKTFSDVVFDCQFKTNSKTKSKDHARIIILIEHQSTPERFLPIRVHHYMLSVLNKMLKQHKNKKTSDLIPAVYPMIFYNGHSKSYPYSTKLRDCLAGPNKAKKHYSNQDIQLINVNQLSSQEMATHKLAGVITHAMKRTNKKHTIQNYKAVLNQLGEIQLPIPQDFTRATIEYMMQVKTISNLEQLIKQNQQLSTNVRGEAMTIAEAFEKRGEESCKEALVTNMLKNGMTTQQVAQFTELELQYVETLDKQQQNNIKH